MHVFGQAGKAIKLSSLKKVVHQIFLTIFNTTFLLPCIMNYGWRCATWLSGFACSPRHKKASAANTMAKCEKASSERVCCVWDLLKFNHFTGCFSIHERRSRVKSCHLHYTRVALKWKGAERMLPFLKNDWQSSSITRVYINFCTSAPEAWKRCPHFYCSPPTALNAFAERASLNKQRARNTLLAHLHLQFVFCPGRAHRECFLVCKGSWF